VYSEIQEPFDEGEDVEYEDDSDDEYLGILKPAFAVDGEPDLESGEPLDGFEYLRRVR
jgi:gem associated protein 2